MSDETTPINVAWRDYIREVAEFWARHPEENLQRNAYLWDWWSEARRLGDEERAKYFIRLSMSMEVLDGLDEMHEVLLDPEQPHRHQEAVREIQSSMYPLSVPILRQAFELGAQSMSDYNDTGIAEVAKRFSQAWFDIGTPEAIQCLRDFAEHPDADIAAEMRYRLSLLSD